VTLEGIMKPVTDIGNTQTIVKNLKAIWLNRSQELGISQKEAAAQLNWTEGALSQYLNGRTALKPESIIKLANFLEVSPIAIAPKMIDHIPHWHSGSVKYYSSSTSEQPKSSSTFVRVKVNPSICSMSVNQDIPVVSKTSSFPILAGSKTGFYVRMKVAEPKEKFTHWMCVTKKDPSQWIVYCTKSRPLKKELTKCYGIVQLVKEMQFSQFGG